MASNPYEPHPNLEKNSRFRGHTENEDIGNETPHTHRPHKSSSTKSATTPRKPAGSVLVAKPINAASNKDVQADALPNPIPASGHSSARPAPTTLVIHPTFTPVSQPTSTVMGVEQHATFASSSASSPDASYSPFPTFPAKKIQISTENRLLVIIFASLGGAFFIVILFVIIKIRNRPKRRMHPTPSLPVLQDAFPDREKPLGEDSPVFGGRERFSASLGRGEKDKWTWTQYQSNKDTRDVFADPLEKGTYLHPTAQPRKQPSLLSRSFSHFSAISTYTSKSEVAGLLQGPSFTADPFADRPKLRNSYRNDRNTIRISVRDCDADEPENPLYYGEAEVMPVVVQAPPATLTTGRERIKAPYTVGSCPSMNSISPCIVPSTSNESDPFQDTPFLDTPYIKTDARRERDTQALTAALGLHSPGSRRSSVFTRSQLYLDDDRSTMPGSPIDAGVHLGNLMMSDYLATPLSPVMPLRTPGRNRVNDKPPRVPSPPPMPTLAQMAMSGNEADYDTYRSPTYSLYGIYSSTRSVYGDKPDPSSRV